MKTILSIAILRAACGACIVIGAGLLYIVGLLQLAHWIAS